MAIDDDELLSPSLGGYVAPKERPWHTGSIFYVAFFGGILAGAVLAWINAGRLPVSRRRRLAVPVLGALGLLATILAALAFDLSRGDAIRFATRIVGVAGFVAIYWLLKPAERVYVTFGPDDDEAFESLWLPGVLATFGLGAVQAAIVYAILSV
ncbi:MAG: hypothetical protein ACM33B_01205 [Pseudomonadota bacterium]